MCKSNTSILYYCGKCDHLSTEGEGRKNLQLKGSGHFQNLLADREGALI